MFAEHLAGYQADRELHPVRQLAWDRRSSIRFPIELPAELRANKRSIRGTTVNISSGGLLMSCFDGDLAIGTRVKVQVRITPTASTKELALVIDGAITRKSGGYVAVQRKRYRFAVRMT
jgi:PilZ domain